MRPRAMAARMIDRDRATAVQREIESGRSPQQREFEAHFVPKESAHSPAFVICHNEKHDNRASGEASKQSKCQHRTSHELREYDGRGPEFSGTIAAAIEFVHELGQIVRLPPVDANDPNAVRSPCGTSVSPTVARNNISAQGKSA